MKKTIACILSGVLLLSLFSPIALANTQAGTSSGLSDPAATDDSSVLLALKNQINAIHKNDAMPDELKIEALVELFFHLKAENLRSAATVDFSQILLETATNKNNLRYYAAKDEFVKRQHEKTNAEIIWHNITVDFESVQVSKSSAAVVVKRTYLYRFAHVDFMSGEADQYTLSLAKTNGVWKIDFIESDDPQDVFAAGQNYENLPQAIDTDATQPARNPAVSPPENDMDAAGAGTENLLLWLPMIRKLGVFVKILFSILSL